MIEKNFIYILGIGLYIIVLLFCFSLFRKTNFTNLKFLLFSCVLLVVINLIYLIFVRIFNNSYNGILLVYATFILNLFAIPTILILFILRILKK